MSDEAGHSSLITHRLSFSYDRVGPPMSVTCVKCSRVNPADAVYCYHDGFALNGHAGRGAGPVAVGGQQFASPFVFPSGRTCRSFDELATACQEDWASARELLAQGFFGGFFGGMGRADLAQAAD